MVQRPIILCIFFFVSNVYEKKIERKKNRQMENEKSYRTGPSRIGRKHPEPRVVGNREKQERTYLPRS